MSRQWKVPWMREAVRVRLGSRPCRQGGRVSILSGFTRGHERVGVSVTERDGD